MEKYRIKHILLYAYTALLLVVFGSVDAYAQEQEPDTAEMAQPMQQRTRRTDIQPPDSTLDNLSAQAWVMVDGRTGKTLSSKNANKTLYPASMTKMMTCILAIESGRLNDTIEISRTAAATSYGKVRAGEKFFLHDLLDVMMLDSDNGAASAIAEFLSTPDNPFSNQMNAKAKELGMRSTSFVNPHGLHDRYHYTTPADIMILAQYCMQNKTFQAIVSQAKKDVRLISPANRIRHCTNTNKLLGTYNGAVGCKTGYTRPAGGCLASCAVRDNLQVFLVVMNCNPARQRIPESAQLLDKGFELASKSWAEDRRVQQARPPVPPPPKKAHQSQKPVPERRKKK